MDVCVCVVVLMCECGCVSVGVCVSVSLDAYVSLVPINFSVEKEKFKPCERCKILRFLRYNLRRCDVVGIALFRKTRSFIPKIKESSKEMRI